jgi:hypothetical protein
MDGVFLAALIVLAVVSLGWTTWRVRRVMQQALGRTVRPGEETSVRTWMEVPDTALESATRQLERDPLGGVMDVLEEAAELRGASEERPAVSTYERRNQSAVASSQSTEPH